MGPLYGHGRDEALELELAECLPDRRPAHAHLIDELALQQAFSRFELARNNSVAKSAVYQIPRRDVVRY